MRLGISSAPAHTSPADWASKLKELGCRSAVFPVDCRVKEETIQAYAKAAKENDLLIAEVGVWKNAMALKEGERQQALDYTIGQLKMADRIHAKCCVNVIGSVGERWDGAYTENFSMETWDRAVHMIREIIDEVKPQNTYFAVEPMPWMYPTSPEEYVKLLEEVNRDRFAVHMDVINMINTPERYFFPEKFLEHCFDLLGDKIKSCHLKDILLGQEYTFQLRECACGEGVFCLERYAALASEIDTDMPMIIEHLHSDEEYAESVRCVRKRLREYL